MRDDALQKILQLTTAVAKGDRQSVQDLLQLTATPGIPAVVAELAEQISSIVVQKEAREFRLEMMIEDLLQAKDQIEEAHRDCLTGLPTRATFFKTLDTICAETEAKQTCLGLLFIDLDRFKQVNDTMGHDAGDALLKNVARRICATLGETDTAARLGGDEFTVILPNLNSPQQAKDLADTILAELKRPFSLPQGQAKIGASIGISLYPAEADRPVTLVKNADIAMYRAKELGRNCCQLYADLGTLL
ncbi:GGDEF domain-containing protein [Paucidesulfovibrio gracilis]|nr:GGDEF domain-containing protein [Paucidesulfovibrio gracilis]